jgi:L-lactate utilization protein LutB
MFSISLQSRNGPVGALCQPCHPTCPPYDQVGHGTEGKGEGKASIKVAQRQQQQEHIASQVCALCHKKCCRDNVTSMIDVLPVPATVHKTRSLEKKAQHIFMYTILTERLLPK